MSKITDKRLVMLTGSSAERQYDGSYKWQLGAPVSAPSQSYTMVVRLEQMRFKASNLGFLASPQTLLYTVTDTTTSVATEHVITVTEEDLYEVTAAGLMTVLNGKASTGVAFIFSDGRVSVTNAVSGTRVSFSYTPFLGLLGFEGGVDLDGPAANAAAVKVTADTGPDLTGTAFLQIESDVGVQNGGAFNIGADPVLAIIPSKLDFGNFVHSHITYDAATHCPHFFSCNKLRLDEISIKILNDKGEPADLHHEWYILLCFGYAVPEELQYPRDPHEATTYKMLADMDGRSYKRSARDYRPDYNVGGNV